MTDMYNIYCVHQQGFHFGDCLTLRLVHSQTERLIVCQFNSQKSILKYSFLVRRTGPVNFQVKTDGGYSVVKITQHKEIFCCNIFQVKIPMIEEAFLTKLSIVMAYT